MSKYFLNGTKLSKYEKLMMVAPNFEPKKKSITETKDENHKKADKSLYNNPTQKIEEQN